jgi:hypothetical protein
MTTYWSCMACEASGEGDKAAEQHVRDTRHGGQTYARPRPPRTSIPFTLTDAGWAATSSGWTT